MSLVLVVDDESSIRDVLTAWAAQLGHEARSAGDADEALSLMADQPAGVVVCDVKMPGHDGLWLATRLREDHPDTALIMATSSQDADTAMESLRLGAVDFLSKPFSREEFRQALGRSVRWHREAEQARQRLAMLKREVHEHLDRVAAFVAATPVESDRDLDALVEGVLSDGPAVEHARRVAAISANMAVHLGIRSPELDNIQRAAMLHDLGRASMPDTILCKASRLSDVEIAIVREQPRMVADILVRHAFLAPAAVIMQAIFEHADGSGYPYALRGEEIPRGARVIAVADALDAMTHHRVHRDARTPPEAVFEIQRCAGSQFDAWAVDALFAVLHLHWPAVARRTPGDAAADAGHAAAPTGETPAPASADRASAGSGAPACSAGTVS